MGAFGGAEAASDRMCIASNATLMLPLSAQDVCFNSNFDGCDGGQISTPWSYIKSTGAVTGGQYKGSGPFGSGLCSAFSLPHCHHHGPVGSDPYPARALLDAPVSRPLVAQRSAIPMPNRHTVISLVTSTLTRVRQSAPQGKQAFSKPSWQVAQSRQRSLCTLISRTMQGASIIMSQEAWQADMLSRWWDGVSRVVRS